MMLNNFSRVSATCFTSQLAKVDVKHEYIPKPITEPKIGFCDVHITTTGNIRNRALQQRKQ